MGEFCREKLMTSLPQRLTWVEDPALVLWALVISQRIFLLRVVVVGVEFQMTLPAYQVFTCLFS